MRKLSTKMMIFNSFNPANDYNFGAQWPNGHRVFFLTNNLLKNKTFEGICVALAGKFVQKELWIL